MDALEWPLGLAVIRLACVEFVWNLWKCGGCAFQSMSGHFFLDFWIQALFNFFLDFLFGFRYVLV